MGARRRRSPLRVAHGDAVSAPITAERLAEIEERANAIHAELDHTRTRCNHCDAVNPPLDEWGCHDGCPDAEEWPTKVERDGTRLEGAAGLREIAGHMTDLVAEVRRLAAALEIARREGAEAMRERCDDAITARLVEAVREVREKTYRGTGAEKDIATAVWEAIDAMRDTVRALPLDAPGSES